MLKVLSHNHSGRESGRTKTKEELDAEMDEYFLKGDEKTAQKKLNDDLDEYVSLAFSNSTHVVCFP